MDQYFWTPLYLPSRLFAPVLEWSPISAWSRRETLSTEQHARLQPLYEQTNPMQLRREIYRRLSALWEIPSSATSVA